MSSLQIVEWRLHTRFPNKISDSKIVTDIYIKVIYNKNKIKLIFFDIYYIQKISYIRCQINSMPLFLINFRKLITGNEEWALYDNSKRKKSWIDLSQPSTLIAKLNIHTKKSFSV